MYAGARPVTRRVAPHHDHAHLCRVRHVATTTHLPVHWATSIKILDLVLRPHGLAKQQIAKLDRISDKNRSKKWSKNRPNIWDHYEESEVILTSKRKVWSLAIRTLQFYITKFPTRLNCSEWILIWIKYKTEILSSLQKFLQIRFKTNVSSKT